MRKLSYAFFAGIGLISLAGAYSMASGGDGERFVGNGFAPLSSRAPVTMRSEPFVSIKLRDMQASSRADINLRIPERYVKLGDATEAVTVNGPLAFYLTYPDMRGGREKQNADIPYCVGLCRGLTQVTLYNSSGTGSAINARLEEYIHNKKKYTLRRSGNFSSIYDEYDVMWKHFPFKIWRDDLNREEPKPSVTKSSPPISLPSVPPPGYVTEDTYDAYSVHPWPAAHIFVFRNQSGAPEIVECRGDFSDPDIAMCEYIGRSSELSNLRFRLSFKYMLMREWPSFVHSLSRLIDGFIVR